MINRTKIVLSIIFIVILGVLFFVDFDLTNIFIYPIAELIVKYRAITGVVLTIFAVLGFAYKNKKTYFSSYKNVVCVVGYIYALSIGIIVENNLAFVGDVILCAADIALIVLDNITTKGKSKNASLNPLDPIKDGSKLFRSRQYQVDVFINFVKNSPNNCGRSICISGPWGMGKTSFINAAIDEMEKNNVVYEEIRINSMELDSFESLVNYFFNRVKYILKKHDIYVGINSEYKKLVSSIVGTVIDEAAGGFLSSLFSTNSNYRDNLQKLSALLGEHLKKVKILVIIDDLERCGRNDNKGMNYLFFIKEIATLNCCTCVFLLNYDEFLEACNIDSVFLEKFFNKRINLRLPNEHEVFANVISCSSEIETLYNSCKEELDKYIKACEKRTVNVDDNQRDEVINQYNNAVQQSKTFKDTFINPRKAGLFSDKIQEFNSVIEQQKNTDNENTYQVFLDKVNYRYQIFLLAFLYVSYPKEYEKIETNGFIAYIDELLSLKNVEAENRNWLLKKEWYYLDVSKEKKFMQSEKYRFIDFLIRNAEELPHIANGITTLQDKYVDSLLKNQKPDSVQFNELLVELLFAHIDNADGKKIERYTKSLDNAFSLYKADLTLEEVMECLISRSLINDLAVKDYYFDILCDHISTLNIVNGTKSLNFFHTFSKIYIQHKSSNVTLYLSLCSDNIDNTIITIGESVYNGSNCDQMVTEYCTEVIRKFKLHINLTNNPFENLRNLIDKSDKFCCETGISNCSYVVKLRESALNSVGCFEKLCKIENLIIDNNNQLKQDPIDNMSVSEIIKRIQQFLDNYTDNKSDLQTVKNLMDKLFTDIFTNEKKVTEDEMEQIIKIIDEFQMRTQEPATLYLWRFAKIKKRQTEKLNNTQPIS